MVSAWHSPTRDDELLFTLRSRQKGGCVNELLIGSLASTRRRLRCGHIATCRHDASYLTQVREVRAIDDRCVWVGSDYLESQTFFQIGFSGARSDRTPTLLSHVGVTMAIFNVHYRARASISSAYGSEFSKSLRKEQFSRGIDDTICFAGYRHGCASTGGLRR